MRTGLAVGVLSAFLAAIFGTLNKRFIEHGSALTVTGLEMAAGAVCLTLIAPILPSSEPVYVMPNRHDAILLLVSRSLYPLAFCFIAGRAAASEHFYDSSCGHMEPVYAILLAIILLGEQRELTPSFYAGVRDRFRRGFQSPSRRGEEKLMLKSNRCSTC